MTRTPGAELLVQQRTAEGLATPVVQVEPLWMPAALDEAHQALLLGSPQVAERTQFAGLGLCARWVPDGSVPISPFTGSLSRTGGAEGGGRGGGGQLQYLRLQSPWDVDEQQLPCQLGGNSQFT